MTRRKKSRLILLTVVSLCLVVSLIPTTPDDEFTYRIDLELDRFKSEFKSAKYAILIDYDAPVFRRRLWVIDLESKDVVMNCHVSHAWNSGFIWATKFSNEEGSRISSRGIFKTLNQYESEYGQEEYKIGMRIEGLEKGVNDKVLARSIVFHPSWGFWSSGCFMSFPWNNKKIVDLTSGGNILIVR